MVTIFRQRHINNLNFKQLTRHEKQNKKLRKYRKTKYDLNHMWSWKNCHNRSRPHLLFHGIDCATFMGQTQSDLNWNYDDHERNVSIVSLQNLVSSVVKHRKTPSSKHHRLHIWNGKPMANLISPYEQYLDPVHFLHVHCEKLQSFHATKLQRQSVSKGDVLHWYLGVPTKRM